jgi:hypothetical protein
MSERTRRELTRAAHPEQKPRLDPSTTASIANRGTVRYSEDGDPR